jgi:hypothetical protein
VRFSGRTLTKTNGSLGLSGLDSDLDSSSTSTTSRSGAGDGGQMGTTEGYFSSPTNSITGEMEKSD